MRCNERSQARHFRVVINRRQCIALGDGMLDQMQERLNQHRVNPAVGFLHGGPVLLEQAPVLRAGVRMKQTRESPIGGLDSPSLLRVGQCHTRNQLGCIDKSSLPSDNLLTPSGDFRLYGTINFPENGLRDRLAEIDSRKQVGMAPPDHPNLQLNFKQLQFQSSQRRLVARSQKRSATGAHFVDAFD